MWWGRKKRWHNEYRVVRRVYGDGRVTFVVEKNSHQYGLWFSEAEFQTEEFAASHADALVAERIAKQYAATVVSK